MEEAKSGTSRRGKNENLLIRKFRNELPPSSTGFSEYVNVFRSRSFFAVNGTGSGLRFLYASFMPKVFFFDILYDKLSIVVGW